MIQNQKTALTKQSSKSAVLGLFTHEEDLTLLTARARTENRHSISCLSLPTKPFSAAFDRSFGCGGGSACLG